MSLRKSGLVFAVATMLVLSGDTAIRAQDSQTELARRATSKVQPVYPELARKMNIKGTVKVQVVVLPNGTVKEARLVGGHPVLGNAALEAVKKWRFEPAALESSGIVDFKFEPRQ